VAAESLRARVLNTILLTFGVLAAAIATAMFFTLNRGLEADLKAQSEVIARALAMSPALVLADEPSGNLDTQSADAVFDLLRAINVTLGTTFLIVTHDPRLADRCDRIIELVDGRIVADRPNAHPARRPPQATDEPLHGLTAR
jgi:energy-coupling factor transporter ATP-binding protein EcfA2